MSAAHSGLAPSRLCDIFLEGGLTSCPYPHTTGTHLELTKRALPHIVPEWERTLILGRAIKT